VQHDADAGGGDEQRRQRRMETADPGGDADRYQKRKMVRPDQRMTEPRQQAVEEGRRRFPAHEMVRGRGHGAQ
jgi:hypothetical protein